MASAEAKTSKDAESKDAPDSWELDDVDVRLKAMNLKPASEGAGATDRNSKAEAVVATSAWDGQPITDAAEVAETGPMQKAASSDDLKKQAKDFMVDNFLYEALQNPRDRLAGTDPLRLISFHSTPRPTCRTRCRSKRTTSLYLQQARCHRVDDAVMKG